MADSSVALRVACASFEGLKRQFQEYSLRYDDLRHAYIEHDGNGVSIEHELSKFVGHPPVCTSHYLWALSHRVFYHDVCYSYADPLSAQIMWSAGYGGRGFVEFDRLSKTASTLLLNYRIQLPIPDELKHLIVMQRYPDDAYPGDAIVLPSNEDCWTRALHWLSWAGAVMPSERMTKLGPCSVSYDRWHFYSNKPRPRTFCSYLDNLFLRSVAAIEWIICQLKDADHAAPTQRVDVRRKKINDLTVG
jgi:hypothetical protein